MTLSDHPMNASVAVSDMDAATEFYEGKLQLVPERTGADGSKVYPSGGAVALHVYPSPEHAGKATATLVTWYVDDVGAMVDALVANGVEFEHYEGVLDGLVCDEDGEVAVPVLRTDTLMADAAARERVARETLDFALALTPAAAPPAR